jgi:DNA-binding LytR/AlgR family response regulator
MQSAESGQVLTCAIVEDELYAQKLLERYVQRVSSLTLLATFSSAVEAYEHLPRLQPTVLFLDIEMPEMTGLEFLRAYPTTRPLTIFTTAYPNYALDGFDLGVVDYLLKPLLFDRFLRAVSRARERLSTRPDVHPSTAPVHPAGEAEPPGTESDFVYLKSDKRIEQVYFDDISLIEGLDDYVKVHLPNRYLVTHLTLYKLEAALPRNRFIRINRSYIIQRSLVQRLEGNTVTLTSGRQLPVGPSYRDALNQVIDERLIR